MTAAHYGDSRAAVRVLLPIILWTSVLVNIGAAETVCSMKVQFEHQAESASRQAYRLGIDFSKSLVQLVHGDWHPLGSAKAVWSRNLSYRQVADRTLNMRSAAPCELPRTFSLMVCVRAIGRAGGPQCRPMTVYTEDARWRIPLRLHTGDNGRDITLQAHPH
ncbi:MAG: hypothetical protein ACON3Z_20080 [Bradymonadia bacterium]